MCHSNNTKRIEQVEQNMINDDIDEVFFIVCINANKKDE